MKERTFWRKGEVATSFGISQQGVAGEMLCYHTEAQGKVRGSELPGIVECNCCHTSRAVYRESIFMSQKGTVFTVAHKVIEINKEQTFKKDYPSTPHSVLCQREENFLITTLSLFFFSVVGLFGGLVFFYVYLIFIFLYLRSIGLGKEGQNTAVILVFFYHHDLQSI